MERRQPGSMDVGEQSGWDRREAQGKHGECEMVTRGKYLTPELGREAGAANKLSSS